MLSKEDREEIIQTINLVAVGTNAKVMSALEMQLLQVERVQTEVTKIEEHLAKQNGRLGKIEEKVADSIKERKIQDQKNTDEITRLDGKIDSTEKVHILACPQNKRIGELETSILEITFLKRYGKIIIAGTVFTILSSLFIALETFNKIDVNKALNKALNKAMIEKVDSLEKK